MRYVVLMIFGLIATPVLAQDAAVKNILASSFQDKGIAKTSRLQLDEVNAACSEAMGNALPADVESKLQAKETASIVFPADGKYIGDYKKGETIAQSGIGMTWKDKADTENGGNCYNCHQLSPKELSYGTLGPSLLNYGKNMGVKDYDSAASQEILKATWSKIYNGKHNNVCSNMPRFGTNKILTEGQMKDIMALLFDPESPVNK